MNTSLFAALLALSFSCIALGQSKDLGHGFRDHGVAAPISNHRGLVATTDDHGHNVVLLWLMDHRGGYAALRIDASSGASKQVPMPFTPSGDTVDAPYASLLSRENKFYTHFNGYFVEFDPSQGAFTASQKSIAKEMAMSITEADDGTIWSVTYPQSGLVSYHPKTHAFHDYGHVYPQNWKEYPRSIATDDAGYVYFALGSAAGQIILFDPATAKATPLFPDAERHQGTPAIYRDVDGKVYGQHLPGPKEPWYEFYRGAARKIDSHPFSHPKPQIAGTQALALGHFPDGSELPVCSLVERKMLVIDPGAKKPREVSFDYTSEGADIMGAIASPDGTITGGTTFPMRRFTYDFKTDRMTNTSAHGQWNALNKHAAHLLVAGYPGGYLLDWDTSKPWTATEAKNPQSNPALLVPSADPDLHRPTHVLASDDGQTLIYSGTPDYGFTGGGLVFYDRATGKKSELTDKQLIPDQSTESIVELPGKFLLAGTTVSPGTGGIEKAREAVLYLLDLPSKKILWQSAVIPGAREYTTLLRVPDRWQTKDSPPTPPPLIYGIADRKIFFIFDPATRALVYQKNFEADLGITASQQGPRILFPGDGGAIYLLLHKGIASIDPTTHEIKLLAESPLPIICGGDYAAGRVYFVNGSHLCSYEVAK